MKKQYLFFAFLVANVCVCTAQLTLEKTYEGQFMRRYKTPVNGEFYFETGIYTTASVNLYGSNHAVLRQIPLFGDPLRKKNVTKIMETLSGELRLLTYLYDSSGAKIESVHLWDKLQAQVSPNPFNNSLTIHLDNPNLTTTSMLSIQVIDPLGKVILQKTTAATTNIALPEVAALPDGFYLLPLVDTEKRQAVLKIIKQ